MKTNTGNFLAVILLAALMGCNHSQHSADNQPQTDTASKQTAAKPLEAVMQKITPCLWVQTTDAKSVADYYLSIFKNGKLKEYRQYKNPPEGGGGKFETATLELNGMELNILAAGPYFTFNESVSFVINCQNQAEVDYYWNALTTNGGQEGTCGWCKDKYGLSWQVVPVEYFNLINSTDPKVREKAMKNTFKQKKLILSELK
jgi:predicted 3-demethylubiquinone-9 3-methyltransferase (glyoxalase superfamily)